MRDGLVVRHALILEHILDEVNASARAIELITENLIGGAGRRAKPTVHTGAQDFVRTRGARILQLFWREFGAHQAIVLAIRNPAIGARVATAPVRTGHG